MLFDFINPQTPEEELPEWYQMGREFFREIECYSIKMYEEMNGHTILIQMRYAAERDLKRRNEEDAANQDTNGEGTA